MKIDIENLGKSYFLNGHEIEVLKNISFTMDDGEMISLTGPSGVGKSTLLHVVGTLDAPSQGTVHYNCQNIWHFSDTKIAEFRNNEIGYVFQFHHLLSEFSAQENVMMPLLMRRQNRLQASKKAREVLSFVGLENRTGHKPGELSGGEQQRVALARALAHEPSVLFADEPTGNLDDKTGWGIIDLIHDYNQKYKIGVLLVTHNKKISESFKTRFVLDQNGLTREPVLL